MGIVKFKTPYTQTDNLIFKILNWFIRIKYFENVGNLNQSNSYCKHIKFPQIFKFFYQTQGKYFVDFVFNQ